MWLLEPVVVIREVNLWFFIQEFLIGLFALGVALYLKRKDAVWLFLIGTLGNMFVEIAGLFTGTRVYDAPFIYKPFMVLSIGIGEAGAGMVFAWLITTKLWSSLATSIST